MDVKQKKGLQRLVFGRTTFVILFLLIQLGILLGIVKYISEYSLAVYMMFDLLGAVTCVYIINKPENPSFKLSWMFPILVFPVFGTLLYFFVELQVGQIVIARRSRRFADESARFLEQDPGTVRRLEAQDGQAANLAAYVKIQGGFPVYQNTSARYFSTGEEMFEQLKAELEKAERFIFLEYFIVERGEMWNAILEILERKVREGVEVRFMYDGMCSLVLLPWRYPEEMEAHGIRCRQFAPIRPALSTYQNNRDHRKIVVIDGRTAFTGGINLADEYINRKLRFGYWKDVGIQIQGDAVKNFTVMFLQLWNLWEKQPVPYEPYVRAGEEERQEAGGQGFVLPFGDSPLDHEPVGKRVYLDMLNTARRYVHIMTPYLILDDELIGSLVFAAKRGVDVSILMPHIPDKKYAFILAHTYYPQLLAAGVKIYEFTPGFIHAKVFVSDDEKAVVGSINLDFRSLYHHFECAVYLYRSPAIADVERDFQDTRSLCQPVSMEDCRRRPLRQKAAGWALRLIAPLM